MLFWGGGDLLGMKKGQLQGSRRSNWEGQTKRGRVSESTGSETVSSLVCPMPALGLGFLPFKVLALMAWY